MAMSFQLDREKAVAAIPGFLEVYRRKPGADNSGAASANGIRSVVDV
jgi:hypothetical protein